MDLRLELQHVLPRVGLADQTTQDRVFGLVGALEDAWRAGEEGVIKVRRLEWLETLDQTVSSCRGREKRGVRTFMNFGPWQYRTEL